MGSLKKVFVVLSLFAFISCSIRYDRQIKKTENYFFQGEFDSAIETVRPLAKASKEKDRLLYLLEVGLIYHTQGNYQKSNDIFFQADQLIESTKKSVSKEILSLIINDSQQNFIGENFERVLVKFYIALNFIMLGDLEKARRYFKKLSFELKDLKYFDASYKQNLIARYLIAILSEYFKDYNNARVEYKNIELFKKDVNLVLADRYVLAKKEGNARDIKKFKRGKKFLQAYDSNMNRVNYQADMGELILIHQAGKSVVKQSRGRLLNDQFFKVSLHFAVGAAIVTRAKGVGLTAVGVMSTLGTAENPIPVYRFRDGRNSWGLQVSLNDKNLGPPNMLNDYSTTVIKNFNSQYKNMVGKNVASIAFKVVAAAAAAIGTNIAVAKSTKNEGLGSLTGLFAGLLVGVTVGSTIKPDLRCWRLLPSNFQIKRIFLKPGEYRLQIAPNHRTSILTRNYLQIIKIEKNQAVFINIRTI